MVGGPVLAALCLRLWLIVHIQHSLDHLELLLTRHLAALQGARQQKGDRWAATAAVVGAALPDLPPCYAVLAPP